MQSFKRYGLGAAGMLSLVLAILLVTGWGSAVAGQISSVLVANTSANPVPVNGTVTVGNTPSVKLDATGNTVGLATGTSVAINGTPSVSVANASTNPVPITNVNDGQDIYKSSNNCHADIGTFGCLTSLATFGSGKRLVIETVSASINVPTGTVLQEVVLLIGQGSVLLTPVKFGSDGTTDYYGVTQQVRAYATDPNSAPTCEFVVANVLTTGAGSLCSVDGYLVNAP